MCKRQRCRGGGDLYFKRTAKQREREKSSLRVKVNDFKRNDSEMTLIRGRKGK